jgi:hypothetical protein
MTGLRLAVVLRQAQDEGQPQSLILSLPKDEPAEEVKDGALQPETDLTL